MFKIAGLKSLLFEGRARVFDGEEACVEVVKRRNHKEGDVLIARNDGPKGGPGMREMLGATALIYGRCMGEKVALITDGRFSVATRGMCIDYTCRDAAEGGPLAPVRDGDLIRIDCNARSIDWQVNGAEVARRRAAWQAAVASAWPARWKNTPGWWGRPTKARSRIPAPSSGRTASDRQLDACAIGNWTLA